MGKKDYRSITPQAIVNKQQQSVKETTKEEVPVVGESESVAEETSTNETPVAEETPVEPVKEVITAALPKEPINIPAEDKSNAILKELQVKCDRVLALGKNVAYATPQAKKVYFTAFAALIDFTFMNASTEVLDRVYKFFVVERNGILAPEVALAGIELANITADRRIKLECFYTAFFALVRAKTTRVPFVMSKDALRQIVKNDTIVDFIIAKIQ